MISIINLDYGNINSIKNSFFKLNYNNIVVTSDKKIISKSKGIIFPGVGNFDYAFNQLHKLKLYNFIKNLNNTKTKILGICLGLHLFLETSEESKKFGFKFINGRAKKFKNSNKNKYLPIPHIGWNQTYINKKNKLTEGLNDADSFYFAHSYFPQIANNKYVLANTNYIKTFPSIVNKKNFFGVQFHPEKSGHSGLKIFKNFINICE